MDVSIFTKNILTLALVVLGKDANCSLGDLIHHLPFQRECDCGG